VNVVGVTSVSVLSDSVQGPSEDVIVTFDWPLHSRTSATPVRYGEGILGNFWRRRVGDW
jgi:hypothetical protein